MEVSLNKFTFVRSVDDNVLFYNSRNEACLNIENGCALRDSLARERRSMEIILSNIANLCGLSFAQAKDDFEPLILRMIGEGLLDVDAVRQAESVEHAGTTGVTPECDDEDPLGDFYSKHGLLMSLHLDITSNCNERCVHCYIPEHAACFLSYESIEKVLSEFRAMNGMTVYVSGGECMTHPEFERILRKCRELDFNIIVLSNLTLCDKHKIDLLKEIGPQYVNVSLYSMKSEEHDAVTTIRGSWDRTMKAILACEEAGIDVRLAAPLLKANRHAFTALKAFAVEHRMHLVPDFNIIARSNHDSGNLKYACTRDELEETLRTNRSIFDMGWAGVCRDNPEARLCDIGRFRIHLNSKGDFYPCPSMYGYVLGNLSRDSLKQIWQGEKLEYLRGLRWKHMGRCNQCEHRQFCEPCLAYNFNATGDMFAIVPDKCQTTAVVHRVFGV